jgi:hypothetical protein
MMLAIIFLFRVIAHLLTHCDFYRPFLQSFPLGYDWNSFLLAP